MVKDVGFRIRVDRTLRARFLAACRDRDKPAAQVLREFMQEYIASHTVANDTTSGGRRRTRVKAGR